MPIDFKSLRREQTFALIYDLMTGQAEADAVESDLTHMIKNEFEEGEECAKLYHRSYRVRVKLSGQLDRNAEGENPDVMEIVDCYEEMQRILCRQAFLYGCRIGGEEQ